MFRPLIAVLPSFDAEKRRYSIHQGNMDGVLAAGGLPVLLPLDEKHLQELAERFDGFLLTGGGDIAPALYGEAPHPATANLNPLRDAVELPLARLLADRPDKPVLAICRGCQALAAALGGSLTQDIPSQVPGALMHRQTCAEEEPSHSVRIERNSLLGRVIGQERIEVNSLHHQAVQHPGSRLKITAWAPDGVPEAVELPTHPFYLGVQWHPERMWHRDEAALALFTALVERACGN